MTNTMGWRRLLTCATIDILLITAAGTAMAAPVAAASSAGTPVLPTLLLIGVGVCGIPLRRH